MNYGFSSVHEGAMWAFFNRIHIVPKTYAEIPVYQQFIDELKANIPEIEKKLPLINEQMALLVRYEIEIDSKLLEQHGSLLRTWEAYKILLDESITSFKRDKVRSTDFQRYKSSCSIHRKLLKSNYKKNTIRGRMRSLSCLKYFDWSVHIEQICQ